MDVLAFSSSTDNFAVGLSVALADARLPLRVNVIIAICNAFGALSSAAFGALLGEAAPTLAPLGAALIFLYLGWEEFSSWKAGESASPLARGAAAGMAWKLAVPMTLNNLAGGVASGVAGVSGAFAGMCALFASFSMMQGGYVLGRVVGPWVERWIDPRVVAFSVFGVMAVIQGYDAWEAL